MSAGLQGGGGGGRPGGTVRAQLSATERLVEVAQDLSMARDLSRIMTVVRHAARELTGADGATFVLRDGDVCFYADEDAVSPLWKGSRFAINECISGWSMLNGEVAVVEDISVDDRIPQDAYRPTFVKSLAIVPIRTVAPVGAIGNYWAERHYASDGEVRLLRALADLTSVAMENVQMYGTLQARIQDAQDAVKLREEFIVVAAHELRTPLTAMMLQLQRLEELSAGVRDADRARLGQCASRSVAAARRFAALVEGLLDASRLTHGQLSLNLEEVDLAELADEVLERFEGAARRVGCALTLVAPAPARGLWDRLRIEHVLTNLVSNAIKYGPGMPVDVAIEASHGWAHVEVRDHGIGIAPEVAGQIFERFGRVGSVSHYGGLGLGLYLAREVITAHGGTIRFASEPGDGCTFIVDLPLRPRGDPAGNESARS